MIRLTVIYRNLLFLIVSLALVFTIMTEVHAVCPAGDLNGDCTVDLHDLAIFAQQWLTSGCSGSSCADLDDFAGVAMSYFSNLGRNWKK